MDNCQNSTVLTGVKTLLLYSLPCKNKDFSDGSKVKGYYKNIKTLTILKTLKEEILNFNKTIFSFLLFLIR